MCPSVHECLLECPQRCATVPNATHMLTEVVPVVLLDNMGGSVHILMFSYVFQHRGGIGGYLKSLDAMLFMAAC